MSLKNPPKVLTSVELEGMVTDQIQLALQKSSETLLSDMDRLISEKLSTQATEMKRIRQSIDRPHKFKKRGNEEQFMINSKAIAKLEDTGDHLAPLLEKDPATFTDGDMASLMSANSTLDEGKDILFHRQKLIKLADKSDSGWKIVEEYESNELADNSDDEKRIAKAEARASRKIRESSFSHTSDIPPCREQL